MNIPQTAIANGFYEVLSRLYGDVKFELAPTIIGGLIVSACTLFGGLMGGRFGLLIGGSVGSTVNSYFGPKILNLKQLLLQLDMSQLKKLFFLLSQEIKNVVVNVLGGVSNGNLQLTNLLEVFSGNSTVRKNVIEIVTNFFKGIYGNRLRPVAT